MSDDVKFNFSRPSPRLNEILSPEENVAKQKEEIRNDRQARLKHPRQNILDDKDMAVGEALHPNEFIRKLRLVNPHLIIEDGGVPGAVAVRVRALDDDPLSPRHGQYVAKYVSGFFKDRILQEFSHFINDRDGIPVREVRGWRTVLLMLIHQGHLSYKKTTEVFGEPQGERGILWREQMQGRAVQGV